MAILTDPNVSYKVCDSAGNVLLDLNDQNTVFTASLDIGFPTARAVITDRASQDGALDFTSVHGSNAVTWNGLLFDPVGVTFSVFMDKLRGLCHPGQRMYLYCTNPGWGQTRRIYIRADQLSAPLSADRKVQVSWVGIDGVFEDVSMYEYNFLTDSGSGSPTGTVPLRVPFTVPASIAGTSGTTTTSVSGLPFPVHFPFGFRNNVTSGTNTSGGSSDPSTGALIITNPGTTTTPPVFRIYGPCTGPQIVCITNGGRMSWPDVSLNAGDYLNVDCKERESTFGGDPNSPQGFDFVTSDWLTVPVGDSQWQLTAATSAAGWGAVMDVRFRWL